ncbi:MAG: hypothetical protein KGH94_03865 [Candidatus Micrarchaeota archaeon]|nr:hypothetical protein [Candidatus Micrarchaeota archaeon]
MNVSFRKGEPKASIIDGLIEKRPGQYFAVTAIEQLYSKQQIKGFVNEFATWLMPRDAASGPGGIRRAREVALESAHSIIKDAFRLYSDQRGFTDETRDKWSAAIDEMRKSARPAGLTGLLRDGRRDESPAYLDGLVPA